jgi:hypothetical protein
MGYILYLLCLPVPLCPPLSLPCLLLFLFAFSYPTFPTSVLSVFHVAPSSVLFACPPVPSSCSILSRRPFLFSVLLNRQSSLYSVFLSTDLSLFCLPVPQSPTLFYLPGPLSVLLFHLHVPLPSSVLPAWSSLPPQFFYLSYCLCHCSVCLSRSLLLL